MKYLNLISDDIQYLKFTDSLTGEELAHVDKDEVRVRNGYDVRYRKTVKSGGHSLINLTFETAICNRSAEEMFEELGYKKTKVCQRFIMYERGGDDDERIYFSINRQYFYKFDEFDNAGNIHMDELKAIVQQCKELGWTVVQQAKELGWWK